MPLFLILACWTEDDGIYSCGHDHKTVADAMSCLVPDGRSFIRARARLDAAQGRIATATKHLQQARAEAQKLDLLPLVLESGLAIAEIDARSGNLSRATATAREAAAAGLGLIASKANAIAHSKKPR